MRHRELTAAADKCYPGEIREDFKNSKFDDHDNPCYSLVKLLITLFDGDIESFYPKFYKTFADATNPLNMLNTIAVFLSFKLPIMLQPILLEQKLQIIFYFR